MQARTVAFMIVTLFASVPTHGIAQTKPCTNAIKTAEDAKFSPGQLWAYNTRPGKPASTLTILKVDRIDKLGIIVHIRVDGIQAHNPRGELVPSVQHMPFTRDAILLSVVKLLRTNATSQTMEGYEYWRTHCGGVYIISVADAVDLMEKTLDRGKQAGPL